MTIFVSAAARRKPGEPTAEISYTEKSSRVRKNRNTACGGSQAPPVGRIRAGHAIYPILIGVAVVVWLFLREFDPAVFDDIRFTPHTVFWLLMAVLFMAGRDAGYMARIRVLSERRLSWRQAFRVIMLWEFTSAVTPSAVGGTSVAVLYVHKEGINVGNSTAIVMLTSLLDELYFAVMFPLLLVLVGPERLFQIATEGGMARGLMAVALTSYALKVAWVALMAYGLFINPRGVRRLLAAVFRLRPLRRWWRAAVKTGGDMVRSSRTIRGMGARFWTEAGLSTFLAWSSRYLVANALIMAFFGVSDQFLLFARQLVMWIMMLIMPTPGGSGFAEYLFTSYCSDLITVPAAMQASAAALIAILWRMVTYYPYLAVGAVMFPRWVAEKFGRKQRC